MLHNVEKENLNETTIGNDKLQNKLAALEFRQTLKVDNNN